MNKPSLIAVAARRLGTAGRKPGHARSVSSEAARVEYDDAPLRLFHLRVAVAASGGEGAGVTTGHGAALGATVGGTLGGWVRVGGPWRLVADAIVGAPVHAVTASDSDKTATGVSGLTLGVALGVGATLPN